MDRKKQSKGVRSICFDGQDYTADEIEFIKAMEAYKRRTKRKFPTFTEVLAVAKSLGYRKGKTDAP